MNGTDLRSILAATDLTESSEPVLRAAGALALAAGADLHVVHSFDLHLAMYPELDLDGTFFERQVRETEAVLERQLESVLPEGVRVASRHVAVYAAHRAILARATDVRADLVVLGPHRRRPLGDRFLGTTADRVIRSAGQPCLVVGGELRLPLRRVLVPVDLSEPALGALGVALGWIESFGLRDPELELPTAQLDVVHVVPRLFESQDLPVGRATIGPRLHRDVEAAVESAELGFAVPVREELVWGDEPAEAVVRYAEQAGTSLLVMSTHGHGAVRRALVGSVASAVARDAGCPVLLLPPAGAGLQAGGEPADEAARAGAGA